MFNFAEKGLLRVLTFAVAFFFVVASRIWADPIDNGVRWLAASGYFPTDAYENAFTIMALVSICLISLILVVVAETVSRYLFRCVMEFFI